MKVVVRIGSAARRAAIARDGDDPGERVEIDLVGASLETRQEIADGVWEEHGRMIVEALGASDTTVDAIVAYLARAREDDAKETQEQDARDAEEALKYAQREEVSRARAAAAKEAQCQHDALLAEAVRLHGRPGQAERHEAGVLPMDEAQELVRTHLLDKLAGPNEGLLGKSDLAEGCLGDDSRAPHEGFRIYTSEPATLTETEWAALKAVKAQAPEGARVTIEHACACCGMDWCGKSGPTRSRVLVTIRRSGWTVRRRLDRLAKPALDEAGEEEAR